jgi:AraC family transcriptional regulator
MIKGPTNTAAKRQPQYLFPSGARFGGDNLVLHATGRRHVVQGFSGPLSIKSVIRGEVDWIVDGRHLRVDSNTFLLLEDGQRYSMDVDSIRPVETCCVFFQHGFVETVAHDATTPLKNSLDSPQRAAPRLEGLSRLHFQPNGPILPQMWSLAARCAMELQPSGFEEDFLTLSEKILMLYREIKSQFLRVPAAKLSTREELFRRLQIAREYLHGSLDDRVSLADVSREACVSPYHLHRAFRRVFRLTPHAYLTKLRLEKARTLLQSGHSALETTVALGFTSPSAFTRLFRSHYGVPPSQHSKIRNIRQAPD